VAEGEIAVAFPPKRDSDRVSRFQEWASAVNRRWWGVSPRLARRRDRHAVGNGPETPPVENGEESARRRLLSLFRPQR
jgi:hypothetical protein